MPASFVAHEHHASSSNWIRAVKWVVVTLLAARLLYLFVSWLRGALT
jgi:hypothetical protein